MNRVPVPILQEDWDVVRGKSKWLADYFRATHVGEEILINALAQVRADERNRMREYLDVVEMNRASLRKCLLEVLALTHTTLYPENHE